MSALLSRVQGAISLKALSVSFSSTCVLGSPPGSAANSHQPGLRSLSGNRYNGMDDSSIEQQRLMDFELVVSLASVVHRRNARRWQKRLGEIKWQMKWGD
jgi:hypothetical protein